MSRSGTSSDHPPKPSPAFDWGGVFALVAGYMVFFVIFVLLLFLLLEFWPYLLRHNGFASM